MRWEKLGQIFCAEGHHDWMLTHAANPVVEHLSNHVFRVYFSARDRDNRSSIAFVDIDLRQPSKVLAVSDSPVLSPGEMGAFDDSGTSMGCLVTLGETRYLYYLGWNLGVTVPWRNSIGLAVSEHRGAPFMRYSRAPIVDRSDADPFSVSYPWVMRDGDIWRMWYGSNLRWGSAQRDMDHLIKYAESSDGIHWQRTGHIALNLRGKDEYALSKPCVVKDGDVYRMWYSYRGLRYRIGYAESPDGILWTRLDEQVGIDVSESGWDSESVEYPCIFDHAGTRYMLYNGNGYGRTGFGLALLVQ